MIERFHPRASCCLDVILHCDRRGIHYKTKTRDIGLGGLCVSGRNCMRRANELRLSLKVRDRYLHIPGRVAWANAGLAGLAFADLSRLDQAVLTMLVSPCWDGQDMLEGLLLVGQVVDMHDLRDCLVTTSLVENDLRKACRMRGRDPMAKASMWQAGLEPAMP